MILWLCGSGFNKWGITSSNVAANIIADKILGKENEYEDLFKARRVEPIRNRVEVENMLKEANKSILMSRFKIPKDEIDDIRIGEGKIIEIDNKKVVPQSVQVWQLSPVSDPV